MNFRISYEDGKIIIDTSGKEDLSLVLTKKEFAKYLACMVEFYKKNQGNIFKE